MAKEDWHLDKKVSVFLIIGFIANLLLSTLGMAWYAAKLDSRVINLEDRPDLTERVIRLEALVSEHGRLLNKVEMVMDKALERMYDHESKSHK